MADLTITATHDAETDQYDYELDHLDLNQLSDLLGDTAIKIAQMQKVPVATIGYGLIVTSNAVWGGSVPEDA